jgi:hypothetical protein
VCVKVVLVLIFSAVVVQLLLFELLHWRLVVLLLVVGFTLCRRLLGSVSRLCDPLLFHLSVV